MLVVIGHFPDLPDRPAGKWACVPILPGLGRSPETELVWIGNPRIVNGQEDRCDCDGDNQSRHRGDSTALISNGFVHLSSEARESGILFCQKRAERFGKQFRMDD